MTSHKMTGTKEYYIWVEMKQRCGNKKNKRYKYYGGRGIKVCKDWEDFSNFYKDMGKKPNGLSLDRINNNKGYFKLNCKWATQEEQSKNKITTVFITHNGETLCMKDWSIKLNIPYGRLLVRRHRGWPLNKLLLKDKKINKYG